MEDVSDVKASAKDKTFAKPPGRPYGIEMEANGRKWILRTKTEKAREEWIDALKIESSKAKKQEHHKHFARNIKLNTQTQVAYTRLLREHRAASRVDPTLDSAEDEKAPFDPMVRIATDCRSDGFTIQDSSTLRHKSIGYGSARDPKRYSMDELQRGLRKQAVKETTRMAQAIRTKGSVDDGYIEPAALTYYTSDTTTESKNKEGSLKRYSMGR